MVPGAVHNLLMTPIARSNHGSIVLYVLQATTAQSLVKGNVHFNGTGREQLMTMHTRQLLVGTLASFSQVRTIGTQPWTCALCH